MFGLASLAFEALRASWPAQAPSAAGEGISLLHIATLASFVAKRDAREFKRLLALGKQKPAARESTSPGKGQ